MNVLLCILRDENGSAMTEYAVILTLLSIAATAALYAIANSSNTSINSASTGMQNYQLNSPP